MIISLSRGEQNTIEPLVSFLVSTVIREKLAGDESTSTLSRSGRSAVQDILANQRSSQNRLTFLLKRFYNNHTGIGGSVLP